MTYKECLEIRKNNLKLIGTTVKTYSVKDVVIIPTQPEQLGSFLDSYRKSGWEAINPFINQDLDVQLYCKKGVGFILLELPQAL